MSIPRRTALVLVLGLFTLTLSVSCWAQRPVDPFALKVLSAMEFVDYPDLLVAITENNSRPWERYDDFEFNVAHKKRPLLDRWLDATTSLMTGDLFSQLLQIHHIFDESNLDFRDVPIDDAGGAIGNPIETKRVGNQVIRIEDFTPAPGFPKTQEGKQLLADIKKLPGFFDEVTPEQLKVLKDNPFLKVDAHSVAEMVAALGRPIKDPSDTVIRNTLMLVRYQYPSAKRWKEKVFTDLLSPALQAALKFAEDHGQLNYDVFNRDTVTPTFRSLNKRMLEELVRKRLDPKDSGPLFFKNHQRLIAVHPFVDYNGRSFRALYRRVVGKPMLVVNFNHDLYTSEQSFGQEVAQGHIGQDLIARGLFNEERVHPSGPPKFYDIAEWWIYAAGKDDGTVLNSFVRLNKDNPGKLSVASKDFFHDVPIKQRIEKKLFDEVILDFRGRLRQQRLAPPQRPNVAESLAAPSLF